MEEILYSTIDWDIVEFVRRKKAVNDYISVEDVLYYKMCARDVDKAFKQSNTAI